MKAPGQRTGKPSRKRDQRRLVEQLTAAGLNGDVVSQILDVNKNKLRREHALALYSGRREAEKQKAAKAEASDGLTREEKHAANVILQATSSHWQTPDHGNLIFPGLDGSGAKTAAEAYAAWLLNSSHWNCSGLTANFSDARVAEFAELKRQALELLAQKETTRVESP
jgi:hypothetical protein